MCQQIQPHVTNPSIDLAKPQTTTNSDVNHFALRHPMTRFVGSSWLHPRHLKDWHFPTEEMNSGITNITKVDPSHLHTSCSIADDSAGQDCNVSVNDLCLRDHQYVRHTWYYDSRKLASSSAVSLILTTTILPRASLVLSARLCFPHLRYFESSPPQHKKPTTTPSSQCSRLYRLKNGFHRSRISRSTPASRPFKTVAATSKCVYGTTDRAFTRATASTHPPAIRAFKFYQSHPSRSRSCRLSLRQQLLVHTSITCIGVGDANISAICRHPASLFYHLAALDPFLEALLHRYSQLMSHFRHPTNIAFLPESTSTLVRSLQEP